MAARYSDLKRFPDLIGDLWDQHGVQCPDELVFVQDKTDDRVRIPILDAVKRIVAKIHDFTGVSEDLEV